MTRGAELLIFAMAGAQKRALAKSYPPQGDMVNEGRRNVIRFRLTPKQ
jgi:hypothetical protein